MNRLLIIFFITGYITSCAPSAYLHSVKVKTQVFNKEKPLIIKSKEPSSISVQEINFISLFKENLVAMNFILVDDIKMADYTISVDIKEKNKINQEIAYERKVLPYENGEFIDSPINYITISHYFRIHIIIFDIKENLPLWEGDLDVDQKFFQKEQENIIKAIIAHLGEDFTGKISLR